MLFEINTLNYCAGDRTILRDLTMQVKEAEPLIILGPSGCGKTSLLSILAGLLPPTGGTIRFRNYDYATLSRGARDDLRARYFGFVFQRLHLIGHLTAAQNIALAQTTPDPARVRALIADLGLSDKMNQKACDLSVGEAQRVAIARAVANNPAVIFADEPTSALDDANTQRVMDLLLDQARKTGATLIAATHDARICDRFTHRWEMTS